VSFDKDYPNRKDWRSSYYDSRRFDRSCRSHGGCPYCSSGKRHRYLSEIERCDIEIRAYRNGLLGMTEGEQRYLDTCRLIQLESDFNLTTYEQWW
jgi:hypothetical protein